MWFFFRKGPAESQPPPSASAGWMARERNRSRAAFSQRGTPELLPPWPAVLRFAIFATAFLLLSAAVRVSPAEGRSPRIIGGERALSGSWPWMVALGQAGVNDNRLAHSCGGVLVHPRWVVTAAHCATGETTDSLVVLAGSTDLTASEMRRFPLRRIIIHPHYGEGNGDDHDIALLELAIPVFQEPISPVPETAEIEGRTAVVIGWGVTAENSWDTPRALQQVALPIVSNAECNAAFNAYNPWFYNNPVSKNMACAGPVEGGRDACYGDSGGPLMVFLKDEWRLAGVVSWGEGCAEPGLFGVYTRVSRYLDFLGQWVPVPGDVTNDGRLGPADAVAILQMVAHVRPEGTETPAAADFNLDEAVTVGDAVGVLRILAGAE